MTPQRLRAGLALVLILALVGCVGNGAVLRPVVPDSPAKVLVMLDASVAAAGRTTAVLLKEGHITLDDAKLVYARLEEADGLLDIAALAMANPKGDNQSEIKRSLDLAEAILVQVADMLRRFDAESREGGEG